MPNRLASESSPYLLQHAENPVDWYAWGPEALTRSANEDRPILLSVGYSSCHWCHVMERESFEDPSTAKLMNDLFVNIKVDREERPDIDQIYMKAVQAMTGRGGWPMTVFLTPDRVPFFGGTYYPPEPRPGIPSFPEVIVSIADAWDNRRDEIRAGGTRLLEALRRSMETVAGRSAGTDLVERASRALAGRYDPIHGGFGAAPKFPQPVGLELLMRHHARSGETASLAMAVHTLRRMAAGGMRDHLGGGFHRYSVDARWLVPHFEKMLYDNALLARAYLDAFRLTDSDDLRDIAEDTLAYLVNDMTGAEGGFYSARDADSEGVEGRFYVWSPDELEDVLGAEDARLFGRIFDVSVGGNFEGESILHLPHELPAVAASEGMSTSELEAIVARSKAKLLERRTTREAPFRDEKVIVSWNGQAIRTFAEAGATFARSDYVAVASRAADFIWAELRPGGRLQHTWMNGEAKITGFLDDYAALGNALLSLHSTTLERRWLDRALQLCDEILDRFWDEAAQTVFDTADDAEALILRPRDPMDNATPSGPSLAAELLARAGRIMNNDRYLAVARAIVDREAEALSEYGPAFGRMLSVLDRLEADPVEIAIVAPRGTDASALIAAAHADLLPNLVIVGRWTSESEDKGATPVPLLEGREPVDDRPTAFVCQGYACQLPVTDGPGVRSQLRKLS
jgi:uncharacterized protein YyaL (SSP411 family)